MFQLLMSAKREAFFRTFFEGKKGIKPLPRGSNTRPRTHTEKIHRNVPQRPQSSKNVSVCGFFHHRSEGIPPISHIIHTPFVVHTLPNQLKEVPTRNCRIALHHASCFAPPCSEFVAGALDNRMKIDLCLEVHKQSIKPQFGLFYLTSGTDVQIAL